MTVATILKAKGRDVVTIRSDATLLEAARVLTKSGIGCVVVGDRKGVPQGILSERDIVHAVATGGPARLESKVETAMSRPVHTCRESDTIDQVMALMTARRCRHLPVVDEDALIGVVSIGDVVKLKIAEAEMETEAMRSYITTG